MRCSIFTIKFINNHEHNLHMICICLFLNKAQTFLFPTIYDLPWFTIILTLFYQIHSFNTENLQNEVDKSRLITLGHLIISINDFRSRCAMKQQPQHSQTKLRLIRSPSCSWPEVRWPKVIFDISTSIAGTWDYNYYSLRLQLFSQSGPKVIGTPLFFFFFAPFIYLFCLLWEGIVIPNSGLKIEFPLPTTCFASILNSTSRWRPC